jgi:hypothetical protein
MPKCLSPCDKMTGTCVRSCVVRACVSCVVAGEFRVCVVGRVVCASSCHACIAQVLEGTSGCEHGACTRPGVVQARARSQRPAPGGPGPVGGAAVYRWCHSGEGGTGLPLLPGARRPRPAALPRRPAPADVRPCSACMGSCASHLHARARRRRCHTGCAGACSRERSHVLRCASATATAALASARCDLADATLATRRSNILALHAGHSRWLCRVGIAARSAAGFLRQKLSSLLWTCSRRSRSSVASSMRRS